MKPFDNCLAMVSGPPINALLAAFFTLLGSSVPCNAVQYADKALLACADAAASCASEPRRASPLKRPSRFEAYRLSPFAARCETIPASVRGGLDHCWLGNGQQRPLREDLVCQALNILIVGPDNQRQELTVPILWDGQPVQIHIGEGLKSQSELQTSRLCSWPQPEPFPSLNLSENHASAPFCSCLHC